VERDLKNRKVVLGLSGGVDSAVAAVLLQEAGADVQALHMTNWEDDDGYCTAADDLQDARSVCEQLNIPLHHANFAKQYRDRVFGNREIKFGVFREYAKRLGGELLATGHYARTAMIDGEAALLKATDKNKDQSYFLHAVSANALAETVFPLGEIVKDEVRRIARDHGLVVHDKKDSTGICFIGERPFREFLSTYLPANPGPIRTPDGREIGRHHGLMYYTLGQRQGLRIGGRDDASDAPWYVVDKHMQENALIVDQGDTVLLLSDGLLASEPTWINAPPEAIEDGYRCMAKIRYRQADQACIVQATPTGGLEVRFDTPQRAVAPGQFAVFYTGDRCLGGAVIDQLLATTASRQDRQTAAI